MQNTNKTNEFIKINFFKLKTSKDIKSYFIGIKRSIKREK